MRHIDTIKAFIKTLINSESFHALVIQSAPGLGKSTAVDTALSELEIDAVSAGSYATPLHIYNTLARHPGSIIILDDTASLFSDPKSMAILKAACWQASGTTSARTPNAARRITWGSTSEKVEAPFVDFSGKLILLTNVLPAGKETESFLSRSLSYRIRIEQNDVKSILMSAAVSIEHFPDSAIALSVARYLCEEASNIDLMRVNLRTLKLGYELAATHPDTWRELFVHLLPQNSASATREDDVMTRIFSSDLPIKEQEAQFLAMTGKSRRTFYNYKRRLGLTRPYRLGEKQQIFKKDTEPTRQKLPNIAAE